ncbi:PKD domain-containing protein [Roseovarius spongiae]|uniref:PKD domain-containing protein n=1 Tax=Roseovarius spongiae TaxID=2320272 RepID=A0A3A8B7B1_9RHOB|nr:right-handed parallel beta-helix repeat-containing protein [Roseovarius spongiae]RKF12441.1 PKD domain-containing protein [Roseovarius spongiae]
MTTYTVSSAEELQTVLNSASGGDAIELAAGDYGNLSLRRLNFDSEVTVRSADPDDPAVFNTINITESSNVTFDSLFIDFMPTENTVEWSSAFRAVQGVSSITLRNSKIEGGDSIAGISPDSEPGEQGASGILGEPIGRAVTISGTNIVVENNDISHFFKGIVMSGSDNSLLNNEIYDLRTSPVVGSGSNLIIDGNYFHDSNPWKMGGAGDHGDYVHLWTGPGGQPMSNITITNNVFSDEEGGSLLGIYLDDNKNGVGYTNVTVEGNVIHSSTGQAVRFENVSDATISRNTILNNDGVEMRGSQLVLTDGSRDIRFEDNIISTFFGEAQQKAMADKGFIFSNNIDVNYDNPNAENFVGQIFADSRLGGSGLWEKILLPGSVAEGLGSPLMHLDKGASPLTPIFKVEHAEGESRDLVLRADQTRGPDGVAIDADAQFIWDFGDGTGATGQVVRHAYADAGRYEATLTVVMPDGATAKAVSEVAIMGADMLSYDPATGLFQAEGYGDTTAIADTDKASVSTAEGHGIDLGATGSQVGIGKEYLSRLFGADSFDMAMTLRADTLGSTGEVARVHGNFLLSIAPRGEVSLQLWTDTQSKTLTTTGVTVNDGADHDIRVVFDGEASSLMIYVDDQLAGATEIEGNMRGDYPRNLGFGNPWGKQNFDGTLTAFDLDVGNQDFPDYKGDLAVIPDDAEPISEPTIDGVDEDGATQPEAPDTEPSPDEPSAPDPAEEPVDEVPPPQDNDTPDSVEPPSDDATQPGQDHTDIPVDDVSAPLYTADFARIETGESGAKLIGDAHVAQNTDGEAEVVLDGHRDFVALGRIQELEDSQQFNLSLDFQRSEVDSGTERMVWNHMKFGVALQDDALLIHVANTDQPFHKAIKIANAGVGDTDVHSLNVAVDAEADRLQVVLDGELLLDEQNMDLDFVGSGGHEWGWSIGTAWNRFYEGSVSDFQLDDEAVFLDDAAVLI